MSTVPFADLPPPATVRQGFPCYAPDLADGNADYPAAAFALLTQVEARHCWFAVRRAVLAGLVAQHLGLHALLPGAAPRRFLEVGCGTGDVLRQLATLPHLQVLGAELHVAALALAQARAPALSFIQADATALPFTAAFDAVGAFDVIEHLDADDAVLAGLARALKPGGWCFIAVPQHPWLWAAVDEVAGHKRRYTRGQLTGKLTRAGLTVRYLSSFCSTLLPLLALARITRRQAHPEPPAAQLARELAIPPGNALLRALLQLDAWAIRHRWSLPAGGSLLAVAQKPG